MNACQDCKWWGRSHYDTGKRDDGSQWDFGDPRYHECKRFELPEDDPEGTGRFVGDELAVTLDGEAYYAALWTQATFGCTAWEKREGGPV